MRFPPAIAAERQKFVMDWVMGFPDATIEEIQKGLEARWGHRMDVMKLCKLRRMALKKEPLYLPCATVKRTIVRPNHFRQVLDLLKGNPEATDKQLAETLGIRERMVRNYLSRLRSSGTIRSTRRLVARRIVRTVVVLKDAVPEGQVSQQGSPQQGSGTREGNPSDYEDVLERGRFDPGSWGNVGSD